VPVLCDTPVEKPIDHVRQLGADSVWIYDDRRHTSLGEADAYPLDNHGLTRARLSGRETAVGRSTGWVSSSRSLSSSRAIEFRSSSLSGSGSRSRPLPARIEVRDRALDQRATAYLRPEFIRIVIEHRFVRSLSIPTRRVALDLAECNMLFNPPLLVEPWQLAIDAGDELFKTGLGHGPSFPLAIYYSP